MKDQDYLDFIKDFGTFSDKWKDKIPCEEFGYAIIKIVSAAMYKFAPNDNVAHETICVSVTDGYEVYKATLSSKIVTKPI